MSEQNTNTYAQFEDSINKLLTGDARQNALNLATFIKEQGMSIGENNGTVVYLGNDIAWLHMDGKQQAPGPWTIWPDVKGTVPDGFSFDDSMKEIALQNVNFCGNCGSECAPGGRKIIFGKEFDNVCGAILAFTDPNAEEIECVKKLLELRKYTIDNGL